MLETEAGVVHRNGEISSVLAHLQTLVCCAPAALGGRVPYDRRNN